MMLFVSITLIVINLSQCTSNTYSTHRNLNYPKLLDYEPRTDVHDNAVIDKDVDLIGNLLSEGKFKDAANVYENGAYSRSYATLQILNNGLPGSIDAHSTVEGLTMNGDTIIGTILEAGKKGDKSIHVLYQENPMFACVVGGNPEPRYDGCFIESGTLTFDLHPNQPVSYKYNKHSDNKNQRTLAGFSIGASQKMRPCPHCDFYTDFFRFFQFYGKADYSREWILAALNGTRIVFDSSAADFQVVPESARAAAVTNALVNLNILPFIIREMEEAVKECKTKCPKEGCSELGIRAVDTAAAYYIGSLEDGKGYGKLLFNVANLECKEFKTCGESGDSTSGHAKANIEVLRQFQMMQMNVTHKACPEARGHKDQITKWMKVILIQGTLRHAYMRQYNMSSAMDVAVGAAYAASVVPFLSACSFTDAEIINNNMEIGARTTDFALVKNTFEQQYTCLGIKCSDIGGYWDEKHKRYFSEAEICTFDKIDLKDVPSTGRKMHWGIIGSSIALIVIFLIIYQRMRRAQKKKRTNKFRESDIDFSDSSDDSDDNIRIT